MNLITFCGKKSAGNCVETRMLCERKWSLASTAERQIGPEQSRNSEDFATAVDRVLQCSRANGESP